jgi:hypothetical protein
MLLDHSVAWLSLKQKKIVIMKAVSEFELGDRSRILLLTLVGSLSLLYNEIALGFIFIKLIAVG